MTQSSSQSPASHAGFSGNATELAALAIECGKDFDLGDDPEKTNERLVRFYVTEGVMIAH